MPSAQRICSFLLVTLLSLATLPLSGCGGDGGTAPGDEPARPLVAGTADEAGGELVHPDVVLTVPAGALDAPTDLAIYAAASGHPFADEAPVYRLVGLPADLGEPVILRFRHGLVATASDTVAFFLGEEREGYEFDRGLAWFAATSRDSAGWCIAELPRGALALGGKAPGDLQAAAADDIGVLVHDDGHFRLIYRRSELDPQAARGVLSAFEYQYGSTLAMGFDFGDFSDIWPLDVYVCDPGFSDCCYVTAPRGAGFFYVVPQLAAQGAALAPYVAHEVLHCAQTFYDPRPPAQWGVLNQERLWLDEATAAWVEAITDGAADYVPVGLEVSYFTAPLAGLAGAEGLDRADYGYGMASFVRYLCEDPGSGQGEETLPLLYEHIRANGDVTDALDAVLDPPVATWLVDLHRKVVEGRLYNPDPPGFTWTVWPSAGSLASGLGARAADEVAVPDLGGALLKFLADGDEPPVAAALRITARPVAGPNGEHLPLSVYGRAPDEPLALLATGIDSLSVANWSAVWEAYEAVMVLVSRPYSTHPGHSGAEVVAVTVAVVPDLAVIDLAHFNRVAIEVTTTNTYSDGNVVPNDLLGAMGNAFWHGAGYFAASAEDTFSLVVDPGTGALSTWLARTRYDAVGITLRRLQGGRVALVTAAPNELIYRCFGAACCDVLTDVFESYASNVESPPSRWLTAYACQNADNQWDGSMIYVRLFHLP